MQATEITVYFVIAIIVGGMIVAVLKLVDYDREYHDFRQVFKLEKDEMYKIDSGQLAEEIAKRWEDCRFGMDNATSSVYVKDNATIDRDFIVKELKRTDKCDVIDCSNKSNGFIVNGTIQTPKIINIGCFNNSLIIK